MEMNLSKQIAELQKKAVKYDNVKERYVEFGTRLKEIIKMSQELLLDIDPLARPVTSRNSTGTKFNVLAAEVYEKMLSGLEVTSQLLTQTYPDLDGKGVQYLMNRIQLKYEGKILKRRDGMKVFLYVQKDI